ncbi:MAG TPA: hypothetical protein VK168_14705 [Saprospiraceae bacterium]|nr:hypothetical protein [Saprospiraceae bacterium]
MRNMSEKVHPLSLWILKSLLLGLGIAALPPGGSMIIDPSGKGVGFPADALNNSPFSTYLIPGFLLTIFMGILPLVSWFGLWKRVQWPLAERLNPFRQWHWSLTLSLVCGVALMVWISVQVTMMPYFFLQPLMFGWGALIVVFGSFSATRNFYRKPD